VSCFPVTIKEGEIAKVIWGRKAGIKVKKDYKWLGIKDSKVKII